MPLLDAGPLNLELRLDQRYDGRARLQKLADRRQNEFSEMQSLTSTTARSGGSASRDGFEHSDIRLLHRDDVALSAQAGVKLGAADVDCVDQPGAARCQQSGEASGRGADIKADAVGDVEMKMIEGRQSSSAPRDT